VPFPLVLFIAGFLAGRQQGWTIERAAAFAVMVAAFILWAIAHVQLGDAFTVRPEARRLVTGGLYARFRSPIYLFGGVGIAAFFVVIGRPLFLLLFLVLIPAQILRTRREAKVLEGRFGDEYREYVRHVWI